MGRLSCIRIICRKNQKPWWNRAQLHIPLTTAQGRFDPLAHCWIVGCACPIHRAKDKAARIFWFLPQLVGWRTPFWRQGQLLTEYRGQKDFGIFTLACKIFVYMSILLPSCVQSRSRAVRMLRKQQLTTAILSSEERGWIQIARTKLCGDHQFGMKGTSTDLNQIDLDPMYEKGVGAKERIDRTL